MDLWGSKHVASHILKYDVFDVNCFIILIIVDVLAGGYAQIVYK
jgi:hypothetical protein